jgi:hypothetical protein
MLVVPRPRPVQILHESRSRLGKCLDPAVQFAPCRSDLAFLKHLASRILDTVTDRLLVYIQSAIVSYSSWRSLRGRSLNQRRR